MTEPAQPDSCGVKRSFNPLHMLRLIYLRHAGTSQVRPLVGCTHRYLDGSSAWSPCAWDGKGWSTYCRRLCGAWSKC